MKNVLSLSVMGLLAGCLVQGIVRADQPWMDKTLSPEKRAALLVPQMTMEEKILEIHMMDDKVHPREVAGVPRLGIPVFKITNGPAGAGPGDTRGGVAATALPAEIAIGASWDPEAAKKFGEIAGQEVRDRGEHLIEGPGINITRVPQNGRNFEYYGEDPYLSGILATAEVKAIQAQGVIAEIKHFAANNQETNRKTINEIIDERTLREIYLPAFERVVKEADPGAVMAAYPSVNGHFCSENPHLLGDILRGDWGFKGFVQSDYTGTKNAAPAAEAGLDLSMQATVYAAGMKDALAKGQVKPAELDEMLLRRFTEMFRFGMFDTVYTPQEIPGQKDGQVARELADESAVLLKNDGGILPLDAKAVKTIAVIGPYAGAASTGGGGSSQVKPLYTVSPVDGIKKRVGAGVNVVTSDGADVDAAVRMAKGADVVLVMLGNKDSEGKDRMNLTLAGKQDGLVAALAGANPRTIVVLKTGGPVLMPWVGNVPAVLEAWYPGEEDGDVLADILFGDVNPSGKLSMSFPKAEKDPPAHTPEQWPGVNMTATYSEKMEVGYRWYDAEKIEPLFAFGFGLSYTTFDIKNLAATGKEVSVDVTNTGKRDGADVVQVYVAAPREAGEPPKQLKGFQKISLKAGETRHLTIALDERAFSVWDTAANKWKQFPGHYEILAGDSSRNLPVKAAEDVAGE